MPTPHQRIQPVSSSSSCITAVTLTTLGFGDVTPISAQARSLSILEAIFGVLFIGAFVARIAGSFERAPVVTDGTEN